MKKKVVCLVIAILMSVLSISPCFAQVTGNEQIKLLNIKEQPVWATQPRGTYISTGILQISNEGNGQIGVFIQTLTHTEVDQTRFGIYLDRWIPSESRYANVASYTFEFNKEDYPDEDLTTKSLSFNIVGQPDDCYYRLRGVHLVVANGTREMLTSQTDGVLITK